MISFLTLFPLSRQYPDTHIPCIPLPCFTTSPAPATSHRWADRRLAAIHRRCHRLPLTAENPFPSSPSLLDPKPSPLFLFSFPRCSSTSLFHLASSFPWFWKVVEWERWKTKSQLILLLLFLLINFIVCCKPKMKNHWFDASY